MKKIILIGGDGYIGWPLALKLSASCPDAEILIIDNFLRRKLVEKVGGESLIPIYPLKERIEAFQKKMGKENIKALEIDACNTKKLEKLFSDYCPDTIFHLGHQPSAPYSMYGVQESIDTVKNNEISNLNILWSIRKYCPKAHLVKLGSFGVYATPGVNIPEGYYYPSYNGKTALKKAPFPRAADDFYHITKINDSNFIALACNKWNLRITDVMQSTVFGVATDETLLDKRLSTRFDYDSIFGTVLNRFVTNAIAGLPLLVYGTGEQRTGLMNLQDCIEILVKLHNDVPALGEHRVINNVTENYSINELAELIIEIGEKWNLAPSLQRNVYNPREENDTEKIEYDIERTYLLNNLKTRSLEDVVNQAIKLLLPLKKRVQKALINPKHSW